MHWSQSDVEFWKWRL